MILLDTDHLTILKYAESDRCKALQARFAASDDKQVATTVITAEEQLRGWLASVARERQVHRQVFGYHELLRQLDFLARWTVVPFDEAAADQFELQRRSGVRRIEAMDLKIASIALARNAMLLSANLRDFRLVPGLRVENWMD
jgi:tRNA(fMet)-specific endonuclease VapC